MFWYILALIVIGFGIYAYFGTRRPKPAAIHPEVNNSGHMHDENLPAGDVVVDSDRQDSHKHNHRSGHGCC